MQIKLAEKQICTFDHEGVDDEREKEQDEICGNTISQLSKLAMTCRDPTSLKRQKLN